MNTDPWAEISELTGRKVPQSARAGCVAPRIVTVPAGRTLYAAGRALKRTMEWGAFEESTRDWYLHGNQLDPEWYGVALGTWVSIYEYSVTLVQPTPAVMSKVADQPGAAPRVGPPKFQYYNPAGFGAPVLGRVLGHLTVSDIRNALGRPR